MKPITYRNGKTKYALQNLNPDEILYIKSDSNYSTIFFYLSDHWKLFTSRTLKYWGENLAGDMFVKVHNSYLINKTKIAAINKTKRVILMKEGSIIPYSRKNATKIDAMVAI